MSASLVCLGIVAGCTALGFIIHGSSEKEKAKQRIEQINQEIELSRQRITDLNELNTKLYKGKDYLSDARSDFKNGGHVLDDVPLCNPEFTSCLDKLDAAILNVKQMVNNYDYHISDLEREKRELQKKV